jgi:O-antigen/teichoic acid export membrane protein
MSFVRAVRANAIVSAAGVLASAAATVVLVRVLAPALYADYMSAQAIILTVTLIAEGGVSAAFTRYMAPMEKIGAAGTLYTLMLRRRLVSATLAAAGVMLLGPVWARISSLDPHVWNLRVFAVLAALTVIGLVQVIPYYGLIALLRHGEAGITLQGAMLLRTLALATAAVLGANLLQLMLTSLSIAVCSMVWLLLRVHRLVSPQRAELTEAVVRDSRHFGLTSNFDKLTSWFGTSNMLLIILAPFYSREALATLGVAGDLGAKALLLATLPLSNIVAPYMSRASDEELPEKVGRASRATSLLFLPALTGIVAVAPYAIPLLFGERYRTAIPLLALLAIPAFVESWARSVLVPAFLTRGTYRLLVIVNIIEAVASVGVAFAGALLDMRQLLLALGLVKVLYAVVLAVEGVRRGVLTPPALVRGGVVTSLLAGTLAWAAGHLAHRAGASVALAAIAFAVTFALAGRLFLRLDPELDAILRRAGGRRFAFAVSWFSRC